MKNNLNITSHKPVLINKVKNLFKKSISLYEEKQELKHEKVSSFVFFDGTLGLGGHSFEMVEILIEKKINGVLVSTDLDKDSIMRVIDLLLERYKAYTPQIIHKNKNLNQVEIEIKINIKGVDIVWLIFESNFANVRSILEELNLKLDFALLDLGFSNWQLNEDIGLSYSNLSQKLDMRYRKDSTLNAFNIINFFEKNQLIELFRKYGDITEPQLAVTCITRARKNKPLTYVRDLVDALNDSNYLVKRVFYALRVFINEEFESLEKFLSDIEFVLNDNAYLGVITFNSSEEKIVLEKLKKIEIEIPNIDELTKNIQSRSAKLQIYQKG